MSSGLPTFGSRTSKKNTASRYARRARSPSAPSSRGSVMPDRMRSSRVDAPGLRRVPSTSCFHVLRSGSSDSSSTLSGVKDVAEVRAAASERGPCRVRERERALRFGLRSRLRGWELRARWGRAPQDRTADTGRAARGWRAHDDLADRVHLRGVLVWQQLEGRLHDERGRWRGAAPPHDSKDEQGIQAPRFRTCHGPEPRTEDLDAGPSLVSWQSLVAELGPAVRQIAQRRLLAVARRVVPLDDCARPGAELDAIPPHAPPLPFHPRALRFVAVVARCSNRLVSRLSSVLSENVSRLPLRLPGQRTTRLGPQRGVS
jgi:hypothetical protein